MSDTTTRPVEVVVTCKECTFQHKKVINVEPHMILIKAREVVNEAGDKHKHDGRSVGFTYVVNETKK